MILLTYQHEKFIQASIESVLQQSFTDFELIIIDDGSTDRTPQLIAQQTDLRIISIRHPNQGIPLSYNAGLAKARGQYVAFTSGDDVCPPDRLRQQLDELVAHGDHVLFSVPEFINEQGQITPPPLYLRNVFPCVNFALTGENLAKLFFEGNYLNCSSCFVPRLWLVQETLPHHQGPFDRRFLQLQDFDLWIRLAKRFSFRVSQKPAIYYRYFSDFASASAPSVTKNRRLRLEMIEVFSHFFDHLTPALLERAFRHELVQLPVISELQAEAEIAFLCTQQKALPAAKLFGIRLLQQMLQTQEKSEYLRTVYQFDVQALYRLSGSLTLWDDLGTATSSLRYQAAKEGLATQQLDAVIDLTDNWMQVTFRSPPKLLFSGSIRWDPVDNEICKLELIQIQYLAAGQGGEGDHHASDRDRPRRKTIPLSAVHSNGARVSPQEIEFLTRDPYLHFQLPEQACEIVITARLLLLRTQGYQPSIRACLVFLRKQLVAWLKSQLCF